MRKTQTLTLICILSLTLILGGFVGVAESNPETIKVGAIYPLSGSIADTGARCKAAIEAGVEIVNNSYPDINLPSAESEGIESLGGAKLKVVYGDHQADPGVGKSEAERLITRENVKALIGSYNSAVTKPASFVAERYGIPFISGCSSSAALTERGLDYFFRLAVTDKMDAVAFLEALDELREEKGAEIESIGLLYENTEFGQHAAMSVEEANEDRDHSYEIAAKVAYPYGATNVDSAITKLKKADPDVVIAASLLNDYVLLVNTMKELKWAPKGMFSFCGGFQDPKSIERLDEDAEHFSGSSILPPQLIETTPILRKTNEIYKEFSPGGVGFDGVMMEIFEVPFVLADALERAGTTDPEKLTEAIRETDIETDLNVGGGIKFNDKGQNILAKSAIVQVQDGEYVTVLPLKVAQAEIVWPMLSWSKR
ncbi:MAG: ABC transporter substrate-binding protein [Candidatus Bipolaricaulota bacterium]